MKKMTKLLLALTLLSFAACTKKKSGQNSEISETLRVGIQTEPPTLDWNKASDTTSSLFINNVMEGLVGYELNDPELALKPQLATSWTSNKDLTEWTFKIRKNVKWNDGTPLTAQHFVDGWQRLLNPETASLYAYFLYGIKNAKAYNEGKIKDASQLGVRVSDEGDLVVQLESPMSFFPMLLTHTSTFPIRLDVVKKHGDQWTEPGNIVTLGAYDLVKWTHDSDLLLQRNDKYYDTKAKTKYIKALIISDTTTMLNLINSGKLDVQRDIPALQLPQLVNRDDYKRHSILGIYYLGLNTKKPPFDDVKVRKAITMAIDRRQITKLLNAGHTPIKGWLPVGMFGHSDEMGIDFDVEKASQLLDEAGFKDRSTLPKIFYGYNTNENHKRVAENIQAQLKKNLGLQVEIRNEEWKVYLNTLKSNPPHIFRMGWLADYPDPDNFLNFMTSDSANNHTQWGNSRFDELIRIGVRTTDLEKRRKIYDEAQKILVEKDLPILPVYSMVTHKMVAKRVKNYPVNAVDIELWKDVELVNE